MGQIATHSEAQREFDEAISYYEKARDGLGREFRDEIMGMVSRIVENPQRYSVRKFGVRRANLDRFPYHVNYLVDGDHIVIVAIAHHKRSPFYWRNRLDQGD